MGPKTLVKLKVLEKKKGIPKYCRGGIKGLVLGFKIDITTCFKIVFRYINLLVFINFFFFLSTLLET